MAMNQTQEAKRLGITRQYLNAIMNHRMRPGIKLAKKISEFYGIPFLDLRPDVRAMIETYRDK